MKNYKTVYKVVISTKEDFETELNKLAEDGFICCGNMNTDINEGGVFYSQLLSKTTDVSGLNR